MIRYQIQSLKLLAILTLAGLVLTACAQPYRSGATKPTYVAPPPPGAAAGVPSSAAPVPESVRGGGAASTQYRADLEACHAFAQARIAHDRRIESDSSAAFDPNLDGIEVAQLSGRMSEFANRNRRSTLSSDCMRAKGYTQN